MKGSSLAPLTRRQNLFATAILLGLAAPAGAQVLNPNAPAGAIHFGRTEPGSNELHLRYLSDRPVWTHFRPVYAASLSNDREAWLGGGLSIGWSFGYHSPFFARASIMPGVYSRGDGTDLGGAFQIRSALELGYEVGNGGSLILMLDHRSNAGLRSYNPGLNTLSLGYSFELR